MTGWASIGASRFAASHVLPAVRAAGGELVGVYSTSWERGEAFARDNSLSRAYPTLEALLEDPAVDAVYVTTTNDLHAEQTIAAAAAGKHVLCEKPLATTLADASAMCDACRDARVVFATNHHLRGAPTIVAMRELIEAGAIGDILAARVFHARRLPTELRGWRVRDPAAGAGVVLDITTHDVDTLRYLLSDEITEVTALAATQGVAEGTVQDGVMGVMRTRKGALASFHDAWTIAHAGTGLELHGTEGSLFGHDLLMPEPVGDVLLRRNGSLERVDVGPRYGLYQHAVERFHAAIEGEGTPLASGEDGVASLAVALAVLESTRTGASARPAPVS